MTDTFYALLWLLAFLYVAILAMGVYFGVRRFSPLPTRPGDGVFVLVDDTDGRANLVTVGLGLALLACVLGFPLALTTYLSDGNPVATVLVGGPLLAGWLLVLVRTLPYLRDMRAGAPGRLELPCHPLVVGEAVEAHYVRRFREVPAPRAVEASLVLFRTETGRYRHVRERCREILLASGTHVVMGHEVRASWTFVVPGLADGDPLDPAVGFATQVLTGHRCHWELEVRVAQPGRPAADSRFELPLRRGRGELSPASQVLGVHDDEKLT